MSIMLVGAVIGLIIIALAIGGSTKARKALMLITALIVGGLLAIWWFS